MVCSFLLLSNIPHTNIPQFAYPAAVNKLLNCLQFGAGEQSCTSELVRYTFFLVEQIKEGGIVVLYG